jgi:hypothetical protein
MVASFGRFRTSKRPARQFNEPISAAISHAMTFLGRLQQHPDLICVPLQPTLHLLPQKIQVTRPVIFSTAETGRSTKLKIMNACHM